MTYQGAIDELKSLENNESMPDWFKPALKKVRETMEMDGRENVEGEWIPVSERLPEKNDVYLVAIEACGCPKRDIDGFIRQTPRKWEQYGDKVVAWMPLPESYTAEDRGE